MPRQRYAELSHFPASEYVHHARGVPGTITAEDTTKFLRTIDIAPPLFSVASLRRLLSITDRELDKCADMCGAKVVPHKWGLQSKFDRERIVAEVNFIDGFTISHKSVGDQSVPVEIMDQVDEGIDKYSHFLRKLTGRRLHDMASFQFMYGLDTCNPEQIDSEIFLVDIEPVFRSRITVF